MRREVRRAPPMIATRVLTCFAVIRVLTVVLYSHALRILYLTMRQVPLRNDLIHRHLVEAVITAGVVLLKQPQVEIVNHRCIVQMNQQPWVVTAYELAQ